MSSILIFDDRADERKRLTDAVSQLVDNHASVLPFEGNTEIAEGESYETAISKWVQKCSDKDRVALIACDKELGLYDNFRGLSATPVSAVAMELGIPFCQYSRQVQSAQREFARYKSLRQWSSEQITLSGLGEIDWAPQIASLFGGFEKIVQRYKDIQKEVTTPAKALAIILENPDIESKLALYGSGEQVFLQELLQYYDPDDPKSDLSEIYDHMPRVLGSWLLLSIMRFPGILVNKDAAASYLNISQDDFSKAEIQSLFETTKYCGPFNDFGGESWWWRDRLDILIGEEGVDDGRDYALSHNMQVNECLDYLKVRAGYYCMLMRQPVSSKNSKGGIGWFPAGADLARLRKDKYDQLTALVGGF